ncbi:MAG: hypothetical protein IJZ77_06470 [Bacilli bacterium]|nr:hypothetical protein [Bacilli bacterium]MBQ8207091.1 hypothetical protein [Bacilli bacterium]
MDNEITVMINCDRNKLINDLLSQGFKKKDNYFCYDTYMLKNNIDKSNMNILDILKECVIVRNIGNFKHLLTYKIKEYDKDNNIINQKKINLKIDDYKDGINFLKVIGYSLFINIYDEILVYEKDSFEICIQYVNDKYLMIEIEVNEKYKSVDEIINKLKMIDIDYDDSNYYVKKAELVYKDIYLNNN